MGTILASAQILRVRETLADEDAVTWSDDMLLRALNDSLKLAVALAPQLNIVDGNIDLIAGSHQTLGPRRMALVDILENVGSEVPVTKVETSAMQEMRRFAGMTPQTDIDHYTLDARTADRFTIWPPNNGSGQVFARYVEEPADIELGDAIPLDDWTSLPLWNLMLGIAYALNTTRQDLQKAQSYTAQGAQMLQGTAKATTDAPITRKGQEAAA